MPAVLADAQLMIEGRPRRRQADGNADDQHDRPGDQQADDREHDVEDALEEQLQARRPEALVEDQVAGAQVLDRDLAGVLLVHGRQVIELHAVEFHVEQLLHRQLAAGIHEAHHDAFDAADRGRSAESRRPCRGHGNPIAAVVGLVVGEADDLDAQLLAALREFEREFTGGVAACRPRAAARPVPPPPTATRTRTATRRR